MGGAGGLFGDVRGVWLCCGVTCGGVPKQEGEGPEDPKTTAEPLRRRELLMMAAAPTSTAYSVVVFLHQLTENPWRLSEPFTGTCTSKK